MRVILAFDSFKGCISAEDACDAAAHAVRSVLPHADVVQLPLSDGGEGLVECVARMLPVSLITIPVHGPLHDEVSATYAISADGSTAYMEMAAASGLPLVPIDKRNPLLTTTYGVGDMIADAAARHCRHIVMGIGGSATCDGGQGMLQSLADHGYAMPADPSSSPLPSIVVACDVTNPLYGDNGAARIFAPQKGATPEQVEQLEQSLRAFAQRTEELGIAERRLAHSPGTGAAGGLGYALVAYLNAKLCSGIDTMLSLVSFDKHVQDADLVITGEGHSDEQTLMGKVPHGVLTRAEAAGVPVHLLSGGVDDVDLLMQAGFATAGSINEGDGRPLCDLLIPETAKSNLVKSVIKLLKNITKTTY